jgi:hypothetical protein
MLELKEFDCQESYDFYLELLKSGHYLLRFDDNKKMKLLGLPIKIDANMSNDGIALI